MKPQNVCILLAAYNGERFIKEQIDSIIKQTHSEWTLIVSCDPSSDGTRDVLDAICREHPKRDIRVLEGPGQGSTANFISMIDKVPLESNFIAFCDQDDVWLEEKLRSQISTIEYEKQPAMVCGSTVIVDEKLNGSKRSPSPTRPPGFGNALVQNIASGNTILLNRGAFSFLQDAKPFACNEIAHDWWCYQIVTGMGGSVFYDSRPLVLYRQHSDNQIGQSNDILSRTRRIKRLFSGAYRRTNDQIERSLLPLKGRFLDQNRLVLEAFRNTRKAGTLQRLRAVRNIGIYRQSRISQLLLYLSFVLGKS